MYIQLIYILKVSLTTWNWGKHNKDGQAIKIIQYSSNAFAWDIYTSGQLVIHQMVAEILSFISELVTLHIDLHEMFLQKLCSWRFIIMALFPFGKSKLTGKKEGQASWEKQSI